MQDVNEKSLGFSLLDKIRKFLRRFVGLDQTDARLDDYGALMIQVADAQTAIAGKQGMEMRRLRWHERNVESLRYSAEKYDAKLAEQGRSLGQVVAGQVKEERRIHLLNNGSIAS